MQFSLRELRARKGKTQKEVAASIGVTTATYNSWEQDISIIKLENFIKLANYFEVKLDDIFLGNNLTHSQVTADDCGDPRLPDKKE